MRRLSEQLVDALYLPAETRVRRRLLDVARAYAGDGGEPDGAQVPLTQEELASLAGTSRATVNKVLREEQEQGAIELGRGRTTVLDVGALGAAGARVRLSRRRARSDHADARAVPAPAQRRRALRGALGGARTLLPAGTSTVLRSAKAVTATLPRRTATNVPGRGSRGQRSTIVQRVPRTIAAPYLPCVRITPVGLDVDAAALGGPCAPRFRFFAVCARGVAAPALALPRRMTA